MQPGFALLSRYLFFGWRFTGLVIGGGLGHSLKRTTLVPSAQKFAPWEVPRGPATDAVARRPNATAMIAKVNNLFISHSFLSLNNDSS